MNKKRTIVVALGGNALQRQGEAASEQQQRVADETVRQLLPLIQAGHNVAIVHVNRLFVQHNVANLRTIAMNNCYVMTSLD